MKNRAILAATLLAIPLVAQAKADELSDKISSWLQSIQRVGAKVVSTNAWSGAEADAIIDGILAKPVDAIGNAELSFLHASLNARLVNSDGKLATRRRIVTYLQASTNQLRAMGGKNAELIVFADEARAGLLMTELAGWPPAANAAWEAARRLGHTGPDQYTYCTGTFATMVGKGCAFPPYQKFFLAQLAGMNPIQARRAIRTEQDALLADVAAPMTDERRAWVDELELRIKVAKSKAQDPQ